MCLVNVIKTYCLISSGKAHPEDIKSTSKLKLTVLSLLAFLSTLYYHIFFEELFSFTIYHIQRDGRRGW